MIESLKNTTSHLIEKYIDILEENGEPNETYKYLAINTFQQNWDLEAENFYKMFRSSFSKVSNLLYQNSWGFIEKSAQNFPEEVRKMFRNLYDESEDVLQRIKTFQAESKKLLPNVKQALKRTNISAQQDERTISVYLAFRFPEKYILYKSDYYIFFCEQLNIKSQKSKSRFLHLQELAVQIIEEGLLDDEDFINTYRKFYPKPTWSDKYLMIQNVLYVVFRYDLTTNQELIIWKEALNYAYKQININPWSESEKPRKYAIKYNDILYPNKYIFRYCITYIKDNYPDFNLKIPSYVNNGQRINDFLKSKGANAVVIEDSINEINKNMNNIVNEMPLNQILYGAPGTGKTYNTKRIAVEIINGKKQRNREEINAEYEDLVNAKQIVFTTFHQSLSYEDFIEGIKPVMDENEDGTKNIIYEVKDGIFKEICTNAKTNNFKKTVDNFEEVWDKLIETVKNEIAKDKLLKIGSWEYGLSSKDSLKYSSLNSPSQYSFTITKQNILDTYQNKQARPSGAFQKDMRDIVEYMKNNFNLKNHKEDKEIFQSNIPYVLIIDEINRGNVSAIFGELITLLEEDKRKGNKEQTEVILPYSNDKFSVPNNVYVIGTMNTADRSVEALDTALRRRFSFVEMQPKPEILSDLKYQDVDLKRLLGTINQRIEVLIDKDHQIGHSYFIGIQNLEDLKQTFKDKIIPLLEEYFYGDFGKIGLVLGGSFIYEDENNTKFPKNFTYENDFLDDKKVYRFMPCENWDEKTFISVYED